MSKEGRLKQRPKPKKQEVKISEEEKKLLEKYKDLDKEPELSNEEASILDILTKRKTLDQITREFNLVLKPLGKPLFSKDQILKYLDRLEEKKLIQKLEAPIGTVWVSVQHLRYKMRGTDKL
ncbi:MAG: hypothetical protein ACFFDN_06820 [Candidatus Hodarchaeota archaeon]